MKDKQIIKDVLSYFDIDKYTEQRSVILDILGREYFPQSVPKLQKHPHIQSLGIHEVTIYRILDNFVDKGICLRVGEQRPYEYCLTDEYRMVASELTKTNEHKEKLFDLLVGVNEYQETLPNKTVDHPEHYNAHPKGIECIDVIEDFPFNIGNAMKYLWRCGLKGDEIEDLKKAQWYINREIEKRTNES